MKLTVIPSCVGGGGQFQFTSSTIVNDTIVFDAGCIGFYHSAQEQARIRHVFLSHTHMDHIASLPIFIENAYEGKTDCVTVHASEDVIDCCQNNLFNDRVWPDFLALSKGDKPFVKMSRFEDGQTVAIDGLKITAVALDHVVPTVGYLLADDQSTVAIVSDTGPTEAVWQRINAEPNLKAVFLETTFPNNLRWLADLSKHLTPAQTVEELKKLTRPARIVIIHLKARYRDQVAAELQALKIPNLELAQFDKPYWF